MMTRLGEMHLQRFRLILVVAVTATIISIIIFSVGVNNGALSIDDSYYFSSQYDDSPRSTYHHSERSIRMTADDIVHQSYTQTFRALSLEETCNLNVDGKTCIESLLTEAMNSTTKSFPWWFITLLRDIPNHTYKFWHNLTIMEPAMDLCTIEKIATTEVRHVLYSLEISCYILQLYPKQQLTFDQ